MEDWNKIIVARREKLRIFIKKKHGIYKFIICLSSKESIITVRTARNRMSTVEPPCACNSDFIRLEEVTSASEAYNCRFYFIYLFPIDLPEDTMLNVY